jgi:hypothetical protein
MCARPMQRSSCTRIRQGEAGGRRSAAGGQPASAVRSPSALRGSLRGRRARHLLRHPETANIQDLDSPVRLPRGGPGGPCSGADGVIAQCVEAGGHVCGTMPAMELLACMRGVMPEDYPVLLAGGIDAGAQAVVCRTRFLMSEESGAHAAYKARLLEATDTVLTELFGVGWPAAHRVIANEATVRWLARDTRRPELGTRSTGPRLPSSLESRWDCSFALRLRRGRAGLCSVPPRRPSTVRTSSRRGRSTPESASSGSVTSGPPSSSTRSRHRQGFAPSPEPRHVVDRLPAFVVPTTQRGPGHSHSCRAGAPPPRAQTRGPPSGAPRAFLGRASSS